MKGITRLVVVALCNNVHVALTIGVYFVRVHADFYFFMFLEAVDINYRYRTVVIGEVESSGIAHVNFTVSDTKPIRISSHLRENFHFK